MTEPLGIADIARLHGVSCDLECLPDVWFWCRRHSPEYGPHKVGKKCSHDCSAGCHRPVTALGDCKDVGPFMSEREANRLGGVLDPHDPHSPKWLVAPLGPEVDRD